MKIPNFFIVGAPKCGSTALYNYLKQHPEVFMSTPKELNYFTYNELNAQNLYYSDIRISNRESYLKIFSRAKDYHKVVGEASVSYLFYPNTPNRLFEFNDMSKIVIILRDPVQRAWSHYLMDRRLGLVNVDFMDIFKDNGNKYSLFFQQYFLLGNYFTQINRYFKTFGNTKIKIIFSDVFKKNTSEVLNDLCEFLEIENIEFQKPNSSNNYIEGKNSLSKLLYSNGILRKSMNTLLPSVIKTKVVNLLFTKTPPKLSIDNDKKLRQYYAVEIMNLEKLIGTNLIRWK